MGGDRAGTGNLHRPDAIEKELARWIKNLKPEWAEKWEQRERMGEADGGVIKMEDHVMGACTAPTFSKTHKDGAASATEEKSSLKP